MKPQPGSLAWELLHASAKPKQAKLKVTPLCPRCEKRHRVYDGRGRLIAYCLECKHEIDKARYGRIKKNER